MTRLADAEARVSKLETTVNTINIKLVIMWGVGTFAISRGLDFVITHLPKLLH